MAKKQIERPHGDPDDIDFPQPPDEMDSFPAPPGHGDDDGFEAMPVPGGRKAAPAAKGRAPVVESFPEGDEEDAPPLRPVRRRAEPEPDDSNYSFGDDDETNGGAFADSPEHHDEEGRGFGATAHGEDDEGHFDDSHGHAAGEGAEDGDDAGKPAGKPPVDRSKLVTFGAAGALILFTGFFGWKYVSNVFNLDAPPPVQVANVSPMGGMPQPKWGSPNTGVGMPQGMGSPAGMPPARMVPGTPQAASLPTAPGMPQNVSMKGPAPANAAVPMAGAPMLQAAPPLPGLSEASPMAASAMPPANMMGGQQRDARPSGGMDPALVDRIERLERRLADLSDKSGSPQDGDKLASLEQRIQGVEARAVAPTTPRPAIMPPTKPPVIQGWSLKGVQNGVAWLNGPKGFVEAKVGTDLGDAGHVKSVARYDQDWVVMTDSGVILRK